MTINAFASSLALSFFDSWPPPILPSVLRQPIQDRCFISHSQLVPSKFCTLPLSIFLWGISVPMTNKTFLCFDVHFCLFFYCFLRSVFITVFFSLVFPSMDPFP
jgi:hypothetical protein